MNLQANTSLGQYRILRLLGRGGMGEVYEVEHRVLQRRYALKLLPEDFGSRTEAIRRFEREAAVMGNWNTPTLSAWTTSAKQKAATGCGWSWFRV